MKEKKLEEIITFLRRSSQLKCIPRYGDSLSDNGDSTAEHSWRLALMVFLIGTEGKVNLNLNHAMALALVHDLAEAKTGDIDAYKVITQPEVKKKKQEMEEEAMREMTNDLSFGPAMYDLWQEYCNRETIEAKFVHALDKLEGFLHIAECGVESYIPKEFHADYADKAVLAFDEAAKDFPEVKNLLGLIKQDLKEQFSKVGVKWIDSVQD